MIKYVPVFLWERCRGILACIRIYMLSCYFLRPISTDSTVASTDYGSKQNIDTRRDTRIFFPFIRSTLLTIHTYLYLSIYGIAHTHEVPIPRCLNST